MKLLGTANAKTVKGEKRGYLTSIIYLAPSDASGVINTCPSASKGCRAACLFTSGRGRMNSIAQARINKTIFFAKKQRDFMLQLVKEIAAFIKSASKKEMIPCVRLNGTSDIAWENIKLDGKSIFEIFPNLQFYDYTKRLARVAAYANGRLSKNYHLTFSASENISTATVRDILKRGVNVAVVYKDALPVEDFGVEVINGDESDLRFTDPMGKIVGLVYKNSKADETEHNGFVRATKTVAIA